MEVRSAKIPDVEAIYSLINGYAERDRMLFRSLDDIYENLQSFLVAETDRAKECQCEDQNSPCGSCRAC